MIRFSPGWLRLATEVIGCAHHKMRLNRYQLTMRLAPPTAGESYQDRMRVLDHLCRLELVKIVDERLVLTGGELPNEILEGLQEGVPEFWSFLESIDRGGTRARKFQQDVQTKVGLEGEKAVMELLKAELPVGMHEKIDHVSLRDDTAGFDILAPSPGAHEQRRLIEVKATTRPGQRVTFYISRNEASVGQRNSSWSLMLVRRVGVEWNLVGHLRFGQIERHLPTDTTDSGRWVSTEITLQTSEFLLGLPR